MGQIGNININNDNMTMRSSKSIFCESFYFIDVYDENNVKKFIKIRFKMGI